VKLSVAPVFPIWLIVVLVVIAIALRVWAFVASSRRRARTLDRWTWLRFGMAVAAILCLGVAATRVGDESEAERPPRLTTTAEETNVNVFLVIDRSLNMTARDFDGEEERLLGVKKDAEVVLAKYPKARFSVLSYADDARVEWPLSPDVWSLLPFVWGFTPYGGDSAEYNGEGVLKTNVTAADELLKDELNKAVHAYPGSANVVFVFGATSDGGTPEFDIPKGQISDGAVFGYGTTAGTTLFLDTGSGYERVPSALDEVALRSAAESLGVPFEERDRGTIGAEDLPDTVAQAAPVDPIDPKVPHPNRIEFYWLFALLAAVLFGAELYGLGRHWLRRRGGGVRR
jgi:hypothetical protein